VARAAGPAAARLQQRPAERNAHAHYFAAYNGKGPISVTPTRISIGIPPHLGFDTTSFPRRLHQPLWETMSATANVDRTRFLGFEWSSRLWPQDGAVGPYAWMQAPGPRLIG
jgi:hypothetical protein